MASKCEISVRIQGGRILFQWVWNDVGLLVWQQLNFVQSQSLLHSAFLRAYRSNGNGVQPQVRLLKICLPTKKEENPDFPRWEHVFMEKRTPTRLPDKIIDPKQKEKTGLVHQKCPQGSSASFPLDPFILCHRDPDNTRRKARELQTFQAELISWLICWQTIRVMVVCSKRRDPY